MTSAMLIIQHIRDKLAAAFFPRRSEWAAASILLGLGWMLSVNEGLMQNSQTKAYDLLLMISPQEAWVAMLIIFASARVLILLINGTWRRSPHARGIGAFLSCLCWTQMVLSFAPSFGYAFRDARTVDHSYAMRRHAGGRQ
jgi:hypothetical protein